MARTFATVSATEIIGKFPELLKHLIGDLKLSVNGVSSESQPHAATLCFVSNCKTLEWEKAPQALFVIEEKDHAFVKAKKTQATVLSSPRLQEAMAKINRYFFNPLPSSITPGIHATVVIGKNCTISKSAEIAAYVVIGDNVVIDDDVKINSFCTIGSHSKIQKSTVLESHVVIGSYVEIGSHCRIQPNSVIGKEGFGYATDAKGNHTRKPHYGKVKINDNVEIGSNVSIDRGTFDDTIIGEGTKIDNQCHFAHNLIIGKNCFITAGFVVAGSTVIGNNCMFGGGTLVAGHIKICDGVHAAGGSIIHKSVDKPGQYGGYPFLPLDQSLKNLSTFGKLSELRKDVNRLKQNLEKEQ